MSSSQMKKSIYLPNFKTFRNFHKRTVDNRLNCFKRYDFHLILICSKNLFWSLSKRLIRRSVLSQMKSRKMIPEILCARVICCSRHGEWRYMLVKCTIPPSWYLLNRWFLPTLKINIISSTWDFTTLYHFFKIYNITSAYFRCPKCLSHYKDTIVIAVRVHRFIIFLILFRWQVEILLWTPIVNLITS